jgi:hypothetical protein
MAASTRDCSDSGLLKAHRDRGRSWGRQQLLTAVLCSHVCAHTRSRLCSHSSRIGRVPEECDLDPAGGDVGFGFNKRIAPRSCLSAPARDSGAEQAFNAHAHIAHICRTFNPKVTGSIPVRPTPRTFAPPRPSSRPCAALRASAIGMSAIRIEDVGDIGIRVEGEVQKQNH